MSRECSNRVDCDKFKAVPDDFFIEPFLPFGIVQVDSLEQVLAAALLPKAQTGPVPVQVA